MFGTREMPRACPVVITCSATKSFEFDSDDATGLTRGFHVRCFGNSGGQRELPRGKPVASIETRRSRFP